MKLVNEHFSWLMDFLKEQYDCFGYDWYGIDIPKVVYDSVFNLTKSIRINVAIDEA